MQTLLPIAAFALACSQSAHVDRALPGWDDVASDHPAGATDAPMPVLAVTVDGAACFKEWVGRRARPDPQIRALGGRVISDPSQSTGTPIQCPEKATVLLERYQESR